jgi:hypothetical protein
MLFLESKIGDKAIRTRCNALKTMTISGKAGAPRPLLRYERARLILNADDNQVQAATQ